MLATRLLGMGVGDGDAEVAPANCGARHAKKRSGSHFLEIMGEYSHFPESFQPRSLVLFVVSFWLIFGRFLTRLTKVNLHAVPITPVAILAGKHLSALEAFELVFR
jgi:hypothetical protein